jgi:hypothetical protein
MLLLLTVALAEDHYSGTGDVHAQAPHPEVTFVNDHSNLSPTWGGSYHCAAPDQSWDLHVQSGTGSLDGQIAITGTLGVERLAVQGHVAPDLFHLQVVATGILEGKGPVTGNGDLGVPLFTLRTDGVHLDTEEGVVRGIRCTVA